MSPFFANQSCDPFQPKERPCLLGNYVDYTVNLSTANAANEVAAALEFAREHNIRFVIRNTGHEYAFRSFLSTKAVKIAYTTIHDLVTSGGQLEQDHYLSGRTISKTLSS